MSRVTPTIVDSFGETHLIRTDCPMCGRASIREMDRGLFYLVTDGSMSLNYLPIYDGSWTRADVETFFMSGICDPCWQAFEEEDEDENPN